MTKTTPRNTTALVTLPSAAPAKQAKSNINANKVAQAFAALEAGDNKHAETRVAQFTALRATGLGGSIPADLRDMVKFAILSAWQGVTFARWFVSDKSKGKNHTGKSTDAFGTTLRVKLSRTDWSRRLGSKVSKLENAYARWLDSIENPQDATGNGAGSAKASPADATRRVLTAQRDKALALLDAARPADASKARERLAAFGDARAIVKALDMAIAALVKA